MQRSPNNPRRGIVLLLVLGMLSLFTVLIISFVVFSSQSAATSASNRVKSETVIPIKLATETALEQLISGTSNHRSALYRKSLLEDVYGGSYQMRVGHSRPNPSRPANAPLAARTPGGLLLLPLDESTGEPQTTLFKVPTNLVPWNDRGALPAPGASTIIQTNRLFFMWEQRPDLDDSFTGRLITFDEGPLRGTTFRVIRSFGNRNGEPQVPRQGFSGPQTQPNTNDPWPNPAGIPTHPDYADPSLYTQAEYDLAGNFVIDLSERPEETIEIDGIIQQLYLVANNTPNALLFHPGPDGAPGALGVDDNGNGTVDDLGELGRPGSDDYGYRFTLNGAPFRGRGRNASGNNGLVRGGNNIDPAAAIELQFNDRLIGPGSHARANGLLARAEPNESHDAADFDNLFLAFQPSDHRRELNSQVYDPLRVFDAGKFNRNIGSKIIPSFHRPAVINYLMNAPIYLPGEDPTSAPQRNFTTIATTPDTSAPALDHVRLAVLIQRIRRATVRPLNVSHFASFLPNGPDLDGDGEAYDGAPGFTGSSEHPYLTKTLNLAMPNPTDPNFGTVFSTLVRDVYNLATWLVNGPWDIDNDGDGLPDSVWVDLDVANTVAPDGTLIRPIFAFLIEDVDGKIDLNHAGSYAHAVEPAHQDGPYDTSDRSDYRLLRRYNQTNFGLVARSLDSFGFGGGLGPAEINFSHLFQDHDPRFSIAAADPFNGPLTLNQLSPRASFLNDNTFPNVPASSNFGLLRTRYGNLLNTRYGGTPYDYLGKAPTSYPGPAGIYLPAAGTGANPLVQTSTLSRIMFPARRGNFVGITNRTAYGRPMDMHGVVKTRPGVMGDEEITVPSVLVDRPSGAGVNNIGINNVANQPYEFGATEVYGDDKPFTPAEYVDFLRGGPLGGRLSQLLGDAVERNPALKNQLGIDSRSFDMPEIPGHTSFVQLLAARLGETGRIAGEGPALAPAVQQSHLDRMLAVELRKGSKLNLNRAIGNGVNDNPGANTIVDESFETDPLLPTSLFFGAPRMRQSQELAFRQLIGINFTNVNANYTPYYVPQANFGTPDFQDDITDLTLPQPQYKAATGGELLARHLYVLMFTLILDRDSTDGVLVRNFPYPSANFTDANARNQFVARRLAQWAVNAVDFRDTNAACTRLRFDPNPFDGWDPALAARNTVWGMEHPELAITEAFAMHDKRLKSNIPEQTAVVGGIAESPQNVDQDADNDGDPRTGTVPDSDMDQFRVPQATAIVEIKNLRTPRAGRLDTATARGGLNQTLLPRDLYDANDRLDLSAVAVDPANPALNSPVWRLAVSEPIDNDGNKSVRWLYDTRRLGGDLEVFLNNRTDELNHLQINSTAGNAIDWLADDDSDLQDARDLLDQGALHGLDVRNVPYDSANPLPEAVTIADDYQNSNTNGEHRLRMERFVWFTPRATLSPANAGLNVLTAPQSAMRQNNVYVNQGELTPGGDPTTDGAGRVLLEPGAYAVVAPRASTIMGQTNRSNQGNNYQYFPVRQRFQFRNLGGVINGANAFSFDYFNFATNNPMTPTYVDPTDFTVEHSVQNVVPIIAQSLYPHEVGAPAGPGSVVDGWAMSPTPVAERVDMGFNISAPLPGEDYYPVPTSRINLAGEDPDGNPNAGYPLVDGYYDYDAPGAERHPDVPFDHQTGRPLADNVYDVPDDSGNLVSVSWNSVGTHQDVRAVFLQRLADPTRPWHHIDNPYITMDFSPIDLTTMNGEEDVTQLVDRNNDGDTNDPEDHYVDAGRGIDGNNGLDTTGGTKYDGNFFAPYVKFDSRRKIPNVDKDRVATQMQCLGSSDPTNIANYQHVEMVKRSWMTTRYNILRRTADAGTNAYWDREVGSMWDNGATTAAASGIDTRHAVDLGQTMDDPNAAFTQSLGFVNREFGNPTAFSQQTLSLSGVSGQIIDLSNAAFGRHFVGSPQGVMLTMPHWLDRDFESPLDLINVPAVSRIGISYSFGPGTRYDDVNTKLRELPVRFGHLLGFEFEFNIERGFDIDRDSVTNTARYPNYSPQDVRTVDVDGDNQYFTGGRAGFEQIFDYVDVGPVWFDSQRWFDTAKVTARDQSFVAGKPAGVQARYQLAVPLFNRAVATLQPPYNYISKHRTPGKVNLNTMTDYVTKGPAVLGNPWIPPTQPPAPIAPPRVPPAGAVAPGVPVDEFLDYGESPENPKLLSPVGEQPLYLSSSPYNNNLDSNRLSAEYRANSRLFANGSIFRALNWAGSTPYELDSFFDDNGFERPIYGSPSIIGDHNRYEEAVDTQFGRSFKAFIESRRGYAGTERVASPSAVAADFGNPYLDWRYPTQFAGLFSVGRASSSGSVQRFMRTPDAVNAQGVNRRVSEMGLLRPHPDFSNRLIPNAVRTAHNDSMTTPPLYSLGVGELPTDDGVLNNTSDQKPQLAFTPPRPLAEDLEISLLRTRLFERPQAELHSNFRSLDHNPYYKYKDSARLANLTTHHSNVYLVRMTVGFFVVDPRSNAITSEYVNSTGKPIRSKSTFMIDRSIPVGFAPGRALNSRNTVIYSEVDQ